MLSPTPATDAPPSGAISLPAAWERWAVVLVLAAFAAFQANSIRNTSFIGQDYTMHSAVTIRWLSQPGWWVAVDDTTRPLMFWVGGIGHWLTGGRQTFEVAAGVASAIAVAALWFLHASSVALIRRPLLRVAALAFVAFLPVTLVTAVVYASDTFTLLPFTLAAWSLVAAVGESDARRAAFRAAVAGLALAVGSLAKLTFAALPFALVGLLGLLVWWRVLPWRRAVMVAMLGAIPPVVVSLGAQQANRAYLGEAGARHGFDWKGTGEMTWSSLLVPKPSDGRILMAPTYWDTAEAGGHITIPMIEDNGYSYPALLLLGVFTDVMDLLHRGGFDRSKPRPADHVSLARATVRAGLPVSVVWLIAIVAASTVLARGLLRRCAPASPGLVIWLGLSLAWYIPLVLTLPFVHAAYTWGYWLPRLVLPAIWGFGLVLFWGLDRVATGRASAIAVVVAVVFQSCLHVLANWY